MKSDFNPITSRTLGLLTTKQLLVRELIWENYPIFIRDCAHFCAQNARKAHSSSPKAV